MLHIAVHYSSGGGYFWTIYPCPCHCCSRMGAVNLGSQLWYMVNHTKLMPVWASLSAGHLAVLWIFIIFIEYLFQRFLRNFLSKINYETWNKRTFTRQIFSWTVTFYSGHSSLAKQSILYSQLWGEEKLTLENEFRETLAEPREIYGVWRVHSQWHPFLQQVSHAGCTVGKRQSISLRSTIRSASTIVHFFEF